MRGVIAVARREIHERRFVFGAALLAGLLPLAATAIPAARGFPPADVRDASAYFVAILFTAVLAVALGATIVGRDLSEKRFGFYFARPLPALAIWGGKFAGAAALCFVSAVLVLFPASILGGGLFHLKRWASQAAEPFDSGGRDALLFAALVFSLIGVAHAVSIVLRSRSIWLLLDVFGLAGIALLILAASRNLSQLGRLAPPWPLLVAAAIVLASIPAALAGGLAQVSIGRTDLRRGHAALSLTMWASLLALGTGLAAGTSWYVHPTARDLTQIDWVEAPPRGDWIVVAGGARHRRSYRLELLYNVSSRKFVRLPGQIPSSRSTVEFSADGKTAAWVETLGTAKRQSYEIVTARLGDDVSDVHRRPSTDWPLLLLSSDGSRMAVVQSGLLTVLEVRSRRSVLSARVSASQGERLIGTFPNNDTLRLVRCPDPGVDAGVACAILNVDLRERRVTQTGRFSTTSWPLATFSPSGDRLLVEEYRPSALIVRDGRTGAELQPQSTHHLRKGEFLSDGRLVAFENVGPSIRLHLLNQSGVLERSVDLGRATNVFVGGPPTAESLIVCVVAKDPDPLGERGRVLLVDLQAGSAREIARRPFYPAAPHWPTRTLGAPGEATTRLLVDPRAGSLVALDLPSGSLRTILGDTRPAKR